ncbi:uncharacterized protein LOC132746877 [Ruditapes philippinarum]|uniref:uncharacterized protein LOC132746877 n=1 Tax=Ruditapes philippinarum TaxID=129788 RepID=UPI00295BDF5F|nr:uncharacterized protein LOC132746877 [Ruditapes philippinarum]
MNVQTEYYIRLLLLLVQCGMLVCRGITERELAGVGLDVLLKPKEPELKRKLLRSQYLILFPKSAKPHVKDIDISLLTVIILDVLMVSTTEKQYVREIKNTRNTLSHNSTAALEETDFTTIKTDLEDALTKLSLGLDAKIQTECSKLIQKFIKEPLDESTALKYAKQLRTEDELLQDFEGMLEEQSEDIVQEIKASESRLQSSLSDLGEHFSTELQKLHTGYTSDDVTHLKFHDTLPYCEQCIHDDNKKTSKFFCEDCTQFLCLECSQSIHVDAPTHRRSRIFKRSPIKIDAKGYDVCHEHKRNLAYICESHNELCCEDCSKEKHQGCETITAISNIASQPKFNPGMEIPRLQNESSLLIAWLSSVESEVDRDAENIDSVIEERRNTLLKAFDDEAQKVKETAATMKRMTKKEISNKRMSCEVFNDRINKAKVRLINMTKCGTACQKVIAQYHMEQFTNTFKSLKDISFVSFQLGHFNVPNPILHHRSFHVNVPETRPVHLYPCDQIKITSADDERIPLYSGLDYLPDGRLIVVDNQNKKLLVLSEKLVVLGSYKFEFHPQCIVVISEDEVAVTVGRFKMIIVLHISITNKISQVRNFEIDLPCYTICMIDDGHFLVGTFNATKPACIVSLAGVVEDINLPRKEYGFNDCFCTFLRDSNKLVFSQRHKNTVTIYDIATRKNVTVKDDKIKEPRGVAVGPFDCIFLCSRLTQSIVQISPDGCIITSFKIDNIWPYMICFSKNKSTLAISNNSKRKNGLQVFKVDFGSK